MKGHNFKTSYMTSKISRPTLIGCPVSRHCPVTRCRGATVDADAELLCLFDLRFSIVNYAGINAFLHCIDNSCVQCNNTVARACCSLLSKVQTAKLDWFFCQLNVHHVIIYLYF